MKRAAFAVFAALVLMVVFHATTANAEDRPYTVTVEGVELTEGTFQANGHINWRTTHGSGSMHFDPNNGQPGGTYIGASFFPIPLAPGECIVWVQVHPFNYHFGENQESPVCAPSSTLPPVSPTAVPEPSSTPSQVPQPSEEPTSTPTPTPSSTPTTTPSPTVSPSPDPTAPTPSPSSEPSPPTVTPSPSPSPVVTPSPETSETASPSPAPSQGIGTPDSPTSSPTPSHPGTEAPTTKPTTGSGANSSDQDTPTPDTLAVTGPTSGLLAVIAIVALLIGGVIATRPRKDYRR